MAYDIDKSSLFLGIEPNWHHIIPPGQKRVVSQGHCIEQCTDSAFPVDGINIFATMTRIHQIGIEVKLRQVKTLIAIYLYIRCMYGLCSMQIC